MSTPAAERRRAKALEIGVLGLLASTTLGTSYALWRGTQVLQALRVAQFDFAPHLARDDPSAYPAFVASVVADWPARVAVHVPTPVAALRVALVVLLGFVAFEAHRTRPTGEDLEAGDVDEARRRAFASARSISGFAGRLLMRPKEDAAAVSTRDDVYVPLAVCQMIDRVAEEHPAERLAFVIVHERSHAESLDDAIWSLGSVNAFLVTGLLSVLLIPASFPSAVILIPDGLVRVVPTVASVGIAAVLAAMGLAMVGTATTGLLASLTAARECSADSVAAAVVGAEHLPYQRGDLGPPSWLEPWRRGCAMPDRLLHVRGAFPRRGALGALAVANWAAVRTGLALATAAPYGPAMGVLDLAFLASLATVLLSTPRVAVRMGMRQALPAANLLAVVAVVGVTLASIDAFAVGKGLDPIFGARWQAALVVPPLLVASALVASASLGPHRPRPTSTAGAPSLRAAIGEVASFAASVPSWGVSYVVGGLCAFAVARVLADLAVGAEVASATRANDVASVAACVSLSLLVAKNMRRPTRRSAIAEAVLAVPIAAATFYVGSVLYEFAAGATPGQADPVDLRTRLASLDVGALPSPGSAFAFAGVMAASWFARARLGRPRSRPGRRT